MEEKIPDNGKEREEKTHILLESTKASSWQIASLYSVHSSQVGDKQNFCYV